MKKKWIITICSLVACLIIAGVTYALILQEKTVSWKDKQDIVIEYGQTLQTSIEELIVMEDFDKDDLQDMTLKNDLQNEDGKEYPAIGSYTLTLSYHDQKLKKGIRVEDTTAPVFNDVNEVNVVYGQSDFDFQSVIQATDLTEIQYTFHSETIDFQQAGQYTMNIQAIDSSLNEATKDITVIVGQQPTNNKVVCIDAGHQARGNSSKEPNGPGSSIMKAKVTTGATGVATGNTESSINLSVALKLQAILQSRGYTVVMCRTSQDVNISNSERATIANNANAGAFVRLHCDSSESSSPTGTMTMAPSTSNPYCSSIASKSQQLAKAILNQTCAQTGSKSRGVSITDTMTGLNWAKVPVTIIEMGFLSNPNEDRLLSDSAYQDKLATGIANGIDEFLK